MPKWKETCDDCVAQANLSAPDGWAYCEKHAREHGLADYFDLTWPQRIVKSQPSWREAFVKAGYTI
jgi:hypothetical protein